MKTDAGEVSDDDEDQDETVEMNGECKLDRQNSKQGSFKRQIVKVGARINHCYCNQILVLNHSGRNRRPLCKFA